MRQPLWIEIAKTIGLLYDFHVEGNIMKSLQNVTVLDTYSETGNTSGTGNHVDMLSVVLFQTDDNVEQISEKLQVIRN